MSLVALLDAKLLADHGARLPRNQNALYARCLATRACTPRSMARRRSRYGGRGFAVLTDREQDALLRSMQSGGK